MPAEDEWNCCKSGCLSDFYRLEPVSPSFARIQRPCWDFVWQCTREKYTGLYKLCLMLQRDLLTIETSLQAGDRATVKWTVENALKIRLKVGKAIEADYKNCARCGAFSCRHRILLNPNCACTSPQLCRCLWGNVRKMETITWHEDANTTNCANKSRSQQREMVKQKFLELSNAMGLLWLWTKNNVYLAGLHAKICATRRVLPSCQSGGETVLYFCFKPFSRKTYVGLSEVSFYDRVYLHFRKGLNNCIETDTKITKEFKEYGPAAFVFVRLLSTTKAKVDSLQLHRLETVLIDWLRPTKNVQKVSKTNGNATGERWGIATMIRIKPEEGGKPFCWRRHGHQRRQDLRNRPAGVALRSIYLERMVQILLGIDDEVLALASSLAQVPPPEDACRQVRKMAEVRYWRLRSLGSKMFEVLEESEQRTAFLRNVDRARRQRVMLEEVRANVVIHYPYIHTNLVTEVRQLLRRTCPELGERPCFKMLRVTVRRAKGKNFKDLFSNVRKVCRWERIDMDARCYCAEAPDHWKIHGHVCARASEILPLPPGWNANSRFYPTREETRKQIDKEARAFEERTRRTLRVEGNNLGKDLAEILQRQSEAASKNFEYAEKGRPQPSAEAERWLRDRLVVGELDKQNQECFAVCRAWYKRRLREYVTENDLERVPCLKEYGRRPGAAPFFDQSWEKRKGWRLPDESKHRFGRLFLLVKKKQLVKKPHVLAIRPVVSFSSHRYRRHYALAGRAIDAISKELYAGWETTTVPQMVGRVDAFNTTNQVHNRPTAILYRDVENMFGSIPPMSALEALRQGAAKLCQAGFRFVWVPKERVASGVNRNLNELANVVPLDGVARTQKAKHYAKVMKRKPVGRNKRMADVIGLQEVINMVRHGIKWNMVYLGRRVYAAPVIPMGNPFSPSLCTFWTATKEWRWLQTLTQEARDGYAKSWSRIRGVDDVMLIVNSLFNQMTERSRAGVLLSVTRDFYEEGVLLLDGTDGEHFGMKVEITAEGLVALRKRESGGSNRLTHGEAFGNRQRTACMGHLLRVIDFSNTTGRAMAIMTDFGAAVDELRALRYRAATVNWAIRATWSRLNFLEKRRLRAMLSLQI